MWIHKHRKISFTANPRTGSREIGYEILKPRGFEMWLGHHGVPWNGVWSRPIPSDMKGEYYWWFSQNPLEWTFYAAHRNHFEVFHSICYAALGKGKNRGHLTPTPQRLETYLWKHPDLYRNSHMLFPVFFEIRTCRELRFDYLRDDVAQMLLDCDLPPLKDTEGHRDQSIHVTRAKPRNEHYSQFLPLDVRVWIEQQYGAEMDLFGYGWEDKKTGDPEVPPVDKGEDGQN